VAFGLAAADLAVLFSSMLTPSRTRALALSQAGQSARAASVYPRGLNEL
jgi:hypothetical protein